jgi:hypothetical protein
MLYYACLLLWTPKPLVIPTYHLQNLVQSIFWANLQISKFWWPRNYANLTQPYSISSLLYQIHPSMDAISWCNMGLAQKIQEMYYACIHHHAYLDKLKFLWSLPNTSNNHSSTLNSLWSDWHCSMHLFLLSLVLGSRTMQDLYINTKNNVQQPSPLSLADQGTSWTPPTLSTVPLAQPEAPKLPHIPQTDLANHAPPPLHI